MCDGSELTPTLWELIDVGSSFSSPLDSVEPEALREQTPFKASSPQCLWVSSFSVLIGILSSLLGLWSGAQTRWVSSLCPRGPCPQ